MQGRVALVTGASGGIGRAVARGLAAAGSWRSALGALPALVALCKERGWPIGPLREHWPAMRPGPSRP